MNINTLYVALALTMTVGCASDPAGPDQPDNTIPSDDDGEQGGQGGQGGNTDPVQQGGQGGQGADGGQGGQGGEEPPPPPPATGDYLWSNAYGAAVGNGQNQTFARGMDAGVLVGTYRGVVSFGGDNFVTLDDMTNMFIAKYDDDGNHLWSRSFSTHIAQRIVQPNAVAVDAAGDVVVVGRFTGLAGFGAVFDTSLPHVEGNDMFIVKLDALGNVLWSRAYGSNGDQVAHGVAIDATGDIAVAGEDDGDALIMLLDASGTTQWSSTHGDAEDQVASDVAFDAAGNLVVVGENEGDIDLGGSVLSTNGFADIFAVSFDIDGLHRWSASYGDAARQQDPMVEVDVAGDIIIAGRFDGTIDLGGVVLDTQENNFQDDIFVAKLDADGNHVWAVSYGESGQQRAHDLTTDSYGRIIIAGGNSGSVDFGGGSLQSDGQDDVFVAKLTSDGAHLWSIDAGDNFDQEARAVAIGADDRVLVAGKLVGQMDLSGNDPMSDFGGGFAIFVAALSQ